ncbi:MAG: ABA4-like family protein [Pseudomonadota bacterium]
MEWAAVFGAVNLLALIAWAALILAPRHPAVLAGVLYIGVGILCVIYAVSLIGVLSGFFDAGDGGANFTSIEGVRAVFASDAGVVIGWAHYLAFDLFVGLWIARDADAKFFPRWIQAPILLATLMAGPMGLLVWILVREPRARSAGRWS